jgi:hypothetical protein
MGLELLADYVLSLRHRGCVLSPADYEVLQSWLQTGIDADDILLEMSEVLPKFYTDPDKSPSGLHRIRKHVDKRLEAKRFR